MSSITKALRDIHNSHYAHSGMFSRNLSTAALISVRQTSMEPGFIPSLCTVILTSVRPFSNTASAAGSVAEWLESSASRRGNTLDKSPVYRGVTARDKQPSTHLDSHLGRACKQHVRRTPGPAVRPCCLEVTKLTTAAPCRPLLCTIQS